MMSQTAVMVVMNETVVVQLTAVVCTTLSYYWQGSVRQGAVFWICLQELSVPSSLWEGMVNERTRFPGLHPFTEFGPEPVSVILM
jgi:hypothetical protein